MANDDDAVFSNFIQRRLLRGIGGRLCVFCMRQASGHTHDQHGGGQFT